MKLFVRSLFALILIAAGALSCYVGMLYGKPYGFKDASISPPPPPFLEEIVYDGKNLDEMVGELKKQYIDSELYKDKDDLLQIGVRGMQLFFMLPGGVLIFLGSALLILPLLFGGKKRTAKKPAAKRKTIPLPTESAQKSAAAGGETATSSGGGAAAAAAAAAPSAAAVDISSLDDILAQGEKPAAAQTEDKPQQLEFLIPDELLDEFGDKGLFYDIDRVVAMAQTTLTLKQVNLVISVLRPDYKPYIGQLSEEVQARVGRQVVQYHMLRLKRGEKAIAADQFALQNNRMVETERETICRRYMPSRSADRLPEASRNIIGNVYTLSEQQRVQQSTLSDTEDWHDISLRNFVSVMQLSSSASTTAG